MLYGSWGLVREGVDILMESVPRHIDLDEMRTDLLAVSGTEEVHDLHVWCLTTRQIALSAHAVVAADADRDRVLADMCHLLQTKFDIHHLTLQLERDNRRAARTGTFLRIAMKAEQTIFYDINTQRDFILHDGKFHIEGRREDRAGVEGAHRSRARSESANRLLGRLPRSRRHAVLKSWGGPYPDHCMAGTPGQQKIDETAPLNPLMLENKEYTTEEIQKILDHHGEIVFRRQQFEELADNAHLSAILRLVLRPYKDIVMYGVYTESCVEREISALVGLGPKLHLVTRRRRSRRRRIASLPRKIAAGRRRPDNLRRAEAADAQLMAIRRSRSIRASAKARPSFSKSPGSRRHFSRSARSAPSF